MNHSTEPACHKHPMSHSVEFLSQFIFERLSIDGSKWDLRTIKATVFMMMNLNEEMEIK